MTHRTLDDIVRRIPIAAAPADQEALLTREWLVTNGLGGYASGTVANVNTRRFHGLLVSALPSPHGRTMMLNRLEESVIVGRADAVQLSGAERDSGELLLGAANHLTEFRLEGGLPVWRYRVADVVFEKRLVMPHRQNTTVLCYTILDAADEIALELQPAVHVRPHEASVDGGIDDGYALVIEAEQFILRAPEPYPQLRLRFDGASAELERISRRGDPLHYRVERRRGYDHSGTLWLPGTFRLRLTRSSPLYVTISTESEAVMGALAPDVAFAAERERRRRLLFDADTAAQDGIGAELVLAADQYLIAPVGRPIDVARAHAFGDEVRTVIAGYHWFTDWGRDTMISLEGLTLATGRWSEAGHILRTFGRYVRDGLVPNMFPEGRSDGLYHTADATLWFFHAVHRYVETTGDRWTLKALLPTLLDIVRHHVRGTRFGIGVDPTDGLLRQGAEGYQLTWMDAKVDGWVVTPRRGKAVEINGLWYNALRLLEQWLREERGSADADEIARLAERARVSFNRRFWHEEAGHCYDVIDGEDGDDLALRPNQLLAISLAFPVLDEARWASVVEVVGRRLVTPVGLRSLDPDHADYKPTYDGDLRTRDAAYHQGTVWGWLIGPWVDAYRKVHPDDRAGARTYLEGLVAQLNEFGVGTVAEIFDAEPPFTGRGCIAQAWSVAELLRCWIATAEESSAATSDD